MENELNSDSVDRAYEKLISDIHKLQQETESPRKQLDEICIKLTAKQIEEIETTCIDIKATENTVKVALNFASNKLAELEKSRVEWWERIIVNNKLDRGIRYAICKESGSVIVKAGETSND